MTKPYTGNSLPVIARTKTHLGVAINLAGASGFKIKAVSPSGNVHIEDATQTGTDGIKAIFSGAVITEPGEWRFYSYAETVGSDNWSGHFEPIAVLVQPLPRGV